MRDARLPFLDLAGSHTRGLDADGIRVEGNVYLWHEFRVHGSTERGVVRLLDARIGGNLECDGAALRNDVGPALVADRMQVKGSVFLRDGFRASGSGTHGAIRITAITAGGLDLRAGQVRNADGTALMLHWSNVGWLRLPADAVCHSGIPDDPGTWLADGQLRLDGFTYAELAPEGADLTQWLRWLRHRTPAYAAQPYQQLAAVHRAAGHEADVRRILIAQQDDLLDRGWLGGRSARAWRRLLRLFLGYGYQSWRALIGLAVVVAFAIGLGLTAGHTPAGKSQFVAAHAGTTVKAGTPCSTLEQIGIGIDRALPLINTGIRARCDLETTTIAGQAISAIAWILQIIAGVLATLVIAGYTGLLRKT
jgi:hypothetical protein